MDLNAAVVIYFKQKHKAKNNRSTVANCFLLKIANACSLNVARLHHTGTSRKVDKLCPYTIIIIYFF